MDRVMSMGGRLMRMKTRRQNTSRRMRRRVQEEAPRESPWRTAGMTWRMTFSTTTMAQMTLTRRPWLSTATLYLHNH